MLLRNPRERSLSAGQRPRPDGTDHVTFLRAPVRTLSRRFLPLPPLSLSLSLSLFLSEAISPGRFAAIHAARTPGLRRPRSQLINGPG